jgi:hypothetical protein
LSAVDPALMPNVIEAATAMILNCAAANSAPSPWLARTGLQRDATMRFARIASFGGSDIQRTKPASLERLGFTVRRRDAAE